MRFFRKSPKESNYVGGEQHWAEVIENVGYGGDMISLHPDEDFNTNSTLIVHPGEQAIFEKNGQIQEIFQEGRYPLKTENYPFISRIRNAFTGGVSTFNCRVYFIRTATSLEIKWGSGELQVRDKKLRIASKVFARGAYRIKVCDGGKFLFKLIGNNIKSFEPESLQDYFRHEFLETIKTELVSVFNNLEGEILGIQSRQKEISDMISPTITDVMADYGIELLKFSISAIEVDLSDEVRKNYEAKVGNASADSNVMDILGDKWAAQQQVDILKTMAANQSTCSIGAGIGMAGTYFGMGTQMMTQLMGQQATPPSMPPFYLYINNQQIGPVAIQQLPQYVQTGALTPETLVWKDGMSQWAAANTIPELQQLFVSQSPQTPPMPPVPPSKI